MQAIQTKYIPCTDFKDNRYKAWIAGGSSITLTQADNLEPQDNHKRVAIALATKMGWKGVYQGGCLPNGNYCWTISDTDSSFEVK